MSEVLKLLESSAPPFLYAAATYRLFHYMDARASTGAKRAISLWLQQVPPGNITISESLVEIFRRIFGPRIFSVRAMILSMIFSSVVSLVVLYESEHLGFLWYIATHYPGIMPLYVGPFTMNMVADYTSLFAIAPVLKLSGSRPLLGLILGGIFACFVVALNYVGFGALAFVLAKHRGLVDGDQSITDVWTLVGAMVKDDLFSVLLLAAFAVHFWLPLFAISMFIAKFLTFFLKATSKVQWFLKQGKSHPLDAIGLVAAAIVLMCSAAMRWFTY
jgi:hypothetical protein